MFDHFIISDHVIERYSQRIDGSKDNIIRRIKKDLSIGKIKHIFNIGSKRHIFCEYGKQFVFEKERGKWVLKTVIKRKRAENARAIIRFRSMYEAQLGEK